MSFSSCPCCVVVLEQQQEQNSYHQSQCEEAKANDDKKPAKTCTVVENGRVVVKQLEPPAEEK